MRQQVMARRCGSGLAKSLWSLAGISGSALAAFVAAAHAQDCPPVTAIARVSIASDGSQGNADSEIPAVSANGCVVGFKSFATNLIPVDTNDKVDVFVRDRSANTTERIPAVLFSGTEPKDNSYPPSLDALGQLVGFG